MQEVGEEEIRLAIEKKDVDSQGVPYITVVTDGSWAKRGYRTNFTLPDEKSFIYLGKNIYSCICALAENKKKQSYHMSV